MSAGIKEREGEREDAFADVRKNGRDWCMPALSRCLVVGVIFLMKHLWAVSVMDGV